MSFSKTCVLLIAFSLFQIGEPFRLNNNANEKINEGTVRRIQNAFIKKYPQAAIDKYLKVMRQLYSETPEERKQGNFESLVLLVEGALYQTEIEREMLSGNSRQYDVRAALERIDGTTDVDADEMTEAIVAEMKKDLEKEFPSAVGEKIGDIFTRVLKAETLTEARKLAIELTVLSMDGARAVVSRPLPVFAEKRY